MIGFSPVPERGATRRRACRWPTPRSAGADCPRDGKPVVAVDHGRQIGLACGNRELGQVRDPQHVRTLGVEVAVHQVLRRLGRLALYEPYRFALLNRGARPCEVISRMTRLADTLTPMLSGSRWTRLYPYPRLLFSNASRTSSSRPESLSGRFMALSW